MDTFPHLFQYVSSQAQLASSLKQVKVIYSYLISTYFNEDVYAWSHLDLGSGNVLKRGRGFICVPTI